MGEGLSVPDPRGHAGDFGCCSECNAQPSKGFRFVSFFFFRTGVKFM